MKEPAHTGRSLREEEELTVIVGQVQQGAVQAYSLIIEHFQRPIYLYCYYLLGSRGEAEDAAQDIFLKAMEHIGGFRQTVSFSAWLYRIARNHCTDLLKKRSKGFRLFAMYRQQAETEGSGPALTDRVHELLTLLTAEERQILLLRALENYNFEQIAVVVGMNPARVRKKYERLRDKLGRQKTKGEIRLGEPHSDRG
ncbi:RNA polymerase sigma factor [Paenibacillus sp. FSL R7-0331]|uniref:RNA polymerase sigma factor n=1 Tax=Paenibacillus sp. FSL R7-0331 TaxID=1536773 RepID=UPI0005A7FC1B|nr:sigma-70 family RNA polymerase sigma factor [Paenibacillus sp. FSL R7-0331]